MVEYLGETKDGNSESTGLRSPVKTGADSVSSRTSSPAKLAPNHSLFMASIDNSPKKKLRSEAMADEGFARVDNDTNAGGRSSTKVIESLHDQIDALTNTNLQLTIQSNNLLEKLEAAQQRENKLLENTSSLKHENENLESMLNRKTRKLKDVEEELGQLKSEHGSILQEKKRLEVQEDSRNDEIKHMEEKMQMTQVQYDAMVDSQKYYQTHYKSQLDELRDELEILRTEKVNSLERTIEDTRIIDLKLNSFDEKYDNMQKAEESRTQFFNDRLEDLLKQLDLGTWVKLYQESKKMVLTYAEKMELEIPANFLAVTEDRSLVDVVSRSSQSASLVSEPNTGMPLKVPKLRNRTHGSSGNNSHTKRSSFYGGNKQVPNSPLPGTLPGVRRSSSRRNKSGASDFSNSSAESSPVLPSNTSRSASSPSPRMVQTSSFRKN